MLVTPVRGVAGRFCRSRRQDQAGSEAGVLAMNYADLAWGKGRPLGTCSFTCRRVWGTQLATRSGRALLEKGARGWAPQGGNLGLGNK